MRFSHLDSLSTQSDLNKTGLPDVLCIKHDVCYEQKSPTVIIHCLDKPVFLNRRLLNLSTLNSLLNSAGFMFQTIIVLKLTIQNIVNVYDWNNILLYHIKVQKPNMLQTVLGFIGKTCKYFTLYFESGPILLQKDKTHLKSLCVLRQKINTKTMHLHFYCKLLVKHQFDSGHIFICWVSISKYTAIDLKLIC